MWCLNSSKYPKWWSYHYFLILKKAAWVKFASAFAPVNYLHGSRMSQALCSLMMKSRKFNQVQMRNVNRKEILICMYDRRNSVKKDSHFLRTKRKIIDYKDCIKIIKKLHCFVNTSRDFKLLRGWGMFYPPRNLNDANIYRVR